MGDSNTQNGSEGLSQAELAGKHEKLNVRGIKSHEQELIEAGQRKKARSQVAKSRSELKKTIEAHKTLLKEVQEQGVELEKEILNIHYMRCPSCGSMLEKKRVTEFGIEAAICSNCGGLFLKKEQIMEVKKHYNVLNKVGRFFGKKK